MAELAQSLFINSNIFGQDDLHEDGSERGVRSNDLTLWHFASWGQATTVCLPQTEQPVGGSAELVVCFSGSAIRATHHLQFTRLQAEGRFTFLLEGLHEF